MAFISLQLSLANLTLKRVYFCFLSWEKHVPSLVGGIWGGILHLGLILCFGTRQASSQDTKSFTHSIKITSLSIHSWWNPYFWINISCQKRKSSSYAHKIPHRFYIHNPHPGKCGIKTRQWPKKCNALHTYAITDDCIKSERDFWGWKWRNSATTSPSKQAL